MFYFGLRTVLDRMVRFLQFAIECNKKQRELLLLIR